MRSPNISTNPEGFTLIELVVVMGLFVVAAGAGLGIGAEAQVFRLGRSEEDTIVSALRAARAQAMRNIGATDHGVHYDGTACRNSAHCFTLFAGDAFDLSSHNGVEFESNGSVHVDWPERDPVFHSLDGTADPTVITLTRGARVTHITIGYEGRIDAR